MAKLIDGDEQVKQISRDATRDLSSLVKIVRGLQRPEVIAARCAAGIKKMRADLERIEVEFDEIASTASGGDADVQA